MFINLTPHTINLPTGPVEPSGQVARCDEQFDGNAGSFDDVPLLYRSYGPVSGLPEPRQNVIYIVSAMVRMNRPDRLDIASPGDMLRDAEGKITGTKNLVVNQ